MQVGSERWLVREMTSDDSPALRRLFEEVFGQHMSDTHWQWKYGEGRGQGIGVWKGDVLIAHYGGVTRALLDNGRPCFGVQGADAAVVPTERGHLTRRGPYFLAASTFHACFIGKGTRHLYGFGFPSQRHYRLASKLNLYEAVDAIVEFSFPPLAGRHWRDVAVMDMAALPTDAAACAALVVAWRRMKADLAPLLLGVRDVAYLCQRYSAHPFFNYQLLAVRRWPLGAPVAFAVVRVVSEQGLEWLDMIGAMENLPLLAQAVCRHASRCGAQRVFGWITESQQHWLVDAGAQIHTTEIVVPANRWSLEPSPDTQRGRWWLMSGDTDFH